MSTVFTGGVLLYPLRDGDTKLGLLEFDCVVSEEHTYQNEVTGYPVQTGFVIADHAIKKNRRLSLNIVMGNALGSSSYVNAYHTSGLQPKGEVVATLPSPQEAHDILEGCVIEARLCQVSTIYGVYNNAVITQYKTKQDVDSATVLRASIEITDIYTVPVTSILNAHSAAQTADEDLVEEYNTAINSTSGE